MKKHLHYVLLMVLYLFAAIQFADLAMWVWSKIYIASHGSFEITPLPIMMTALIGTSIGYFMVWRIIKGIDAEVDAAIDGFADYIVKRLTKSLDKMEEGAGNE